MKATWYAIPITAGIEKLAAATQSTTSSALVMILERGNAALTTTSVAGGEKIVSKAGLEGVVFGGVVGTFVLWDEDVIDWGATNAEKVVGRPRKFHAVKSATKVASDMVHEW